ncbi:hypothetical protein [Streptococcus sp.]|nr:hypothetical protein [Streptococcus sp.]
MQSRLTKRKEKTLNNINQATKLVTAITNLVKALATLFKVFF